MIKKDSYYTARVKDLIRKAKAYDMIREVLVSDISGVSTLLAIGNIVANTEAKFKYGGVDAAADNRDGAKQNI